MKNGIVIGTIACVVAIILIGSALAPIINIATTTTTTIDNDGAVGLRMDKVSSGDFTINYGLVGDDFTATNGTDTQVIDDLCIFYADNNVAVWMDDSSIIMLGKDADNKTIDEKLSDESTITITKSSAGLEITDGTITQTFPVPTWAYIPKSTGSYGFFLNETEINTGGLPVQYVGSFAGVNCYNSINSFDLPITLVAALTDSELSGARWIEQANETTPEELNPDELHIIPLDPSVINLDPEPDASIMTVPTPTYTDGDWGYDLITSGQNAGKAKIVSYSGSGGDIIVPSSLGGHAVWQFGKGSNGNVVFDDTIISDNSTLTLPEGLNEVNDYALTGCTKLKSVSFPQSLRIIGTQSFDGCTGLTGVLTLTPNIYYMSNYCFRGCTGLTGIIFPDTLKFYGSNSYQFYECTGLIGSVPTPPACYDPSWTGTSVFRGCTGLTSINVPSGMVKIPDNYAYETGITDIVINEGVQTIGQYSFAYTPISGNIVLPSTLTTINSGAFKGCTGLDGTLVSKSSSLTIYGEFNSSASANIKNLVLMGTITANNSAFTGNYVENVLNLSGDEYTPITGINNPTVRTDITALGYLAPTQFKETVKNDGPESVLLNVIPLITIVGVLMFAVGFTIYRRFD